MNTLKKIWDWIYLSSVNANKISLTVKAFLYGLIPGIIFFSGLMKMQIGSAQLTQIIDTIAQSIVLFGGLITSLAFLYGSLRKIILTLLGKNDVFQ